MLSAEETQSSLLGAWRLMLGKADGLRLLDLTADGFWNSFFAIVVAAPVMILNWVGIANAITRIDAEPRRFGLLVELGAIDLLAWTLPLIALALVARHAGVGDRFVHYVVASNWAAAITTWISLPLVVTRLFLPFTGDISTAVWFATAVATIVLGWRMTNASIGKGAAVGTAVFVGMLVVSLVVQFALQALFGIYLPGDA